MQMNNIALSQQFLDIVVTNITHKGDAFAMTGTGDVVYITPSLVDSCEISQGQHRRIKVVPNSPEHVARGIPFRAYFVERENDQPTPAPVTYATDETVVLEELRACEMMSTGDIAEFLDKDSMVVRRLMDKLHKAGRVVRADVYVNHDQTKASRSVWAIDDTVFNSLDV